MTAQPPKSETSSNSDLWFSLAVTAVMVTAPIAIGWLSEKMAQPGSRAGAPAGQPPLGRPLTPGAPALPNQKDPKPATGELVQLAYRDLTAQDRRGELVQLAYRDLTAQDRRGELPPITGRKREVDRLVTLLSGPKPECVLLVGEPGIGKTALVEGLVQALHSGRAADLKGYAILEFRPGCLAGANGQDRTDLEAAGREFVAALGEAQDEVIAFLDDFQAFARLAEGIYVNQAVLNTLKQALADRKVRLVAAISTDDYRRYIENDSTWDGCFNRLHLEKRAAPGEPFGELTYDQTYAVLSERARSFPRLYGLQVRPAAIEAAMALSEAHLAAGRQPGKALQLLEETARRLRPRPDAEPWELMALDEKIESLAQKRQRLAAETSPRAAGQRAELDGQLEELRTQREYLQKRWRSLREARQALFRLVEKTVVLSRGIESAMLNQADFLLARYQQDLAACQAQQAEIEKNLEALRGSFRGFKDYLDDTDVALILEEKTGRPVQLPSRDEESQLLRLEQRLHERVVGQEAAIQALANAVRRNRAGLSSGQRPVGTFMFLGPTGVGKTELAKAVAEVQFGGEHALVRLDMSEYHDRHAVARMIGAPPGYVGYEGGGQLTEAVRHHPASVVLLDEIEKADPKVLDILLQVLDEGRLTDGHGRTVDFQHALVIMTSNLGSHEILQQGAAAAASQVERLLNSTLRPEFLNRVDEKIYFDALTAAQLRQIVLLELRGPQARLREQYNLELKLAEPALALILERGYSPQYGAREVKRKIRELVLDPLVPLLLRKTFPPGATVVVTSGGSAGSPLVFSAASQPQEGASQ